MLQFILNVNFINKIGIGDNVIPPELDFLTLDDDQLTLDGEELYLGD